MERFFGPGARNGLKQMGGINKVAIALSGKSMDKSVLISNKKVFLMADEPFYIYSVDSFIDWFID